jgi:hypothetical protein
MYDNNFCCDSGPTIEIHEIVPCVVDTDKIKATQWSEHDGRYAAVSNTVATIPSGYYSIGFNNEMGVHFVKEEPKLNKLYRLPNEASDIILNDIDKFWTLEETYEKYERVFKRNYLIYSEPGTGKTSLINLMCQDLINKYEGIVVSLNTPREVELFVDAIKLFRKVEPNRRVIVIIEDIDSYCDYNNRFNSELLNILDGNLKVNNMVTIATTNYIDRLEARYTNRPSRFDRVVEFPLPNDECRRLFIEQTVKSEDLSKIDIDKWVEKTNGFTIDHINELILMYFVFGHNEDESIATIDKMVNNNNHLHNECSKNNKHKIGFNG